MLKVRATVHFASASSGKKRSFLSGYRPMFKVRDDDDWSSGEIRLLGADAVQEGSSVHAEITFLHPERVRSYLRIGQRYPFSEGDRRIGEFEVLQLIED
jgi:hypothetical protein